MIIHQAQIETKDGRCRISAEIEIETPGKVFRKTKSARQTLWFDWPEAYFVPQTPKADPFALVCMPVAMRLGEPLRLRDEISQSLLINMMEAIEIYCDYFPKRHTSIAIEGQAEFRTQSEEERVGAFYSGGVDSLYNIAEMRRLNQVHGCSQVTDLWLIQGMDIALDQEELWQETKERIFKQLAPEDQFRYADVRTNARDLHDRYANWTKTGFSVILGAIAKCFAEEVPTALIGSYAKYKDIIPHASSPLVDPMWSCDQQLVRHFSCRVDRQEKINTIGAVTPHLLQGLRVCYENPGEAYNCGRCEKCMRTQAQLLVAGHLDKVPTFDAPLDAEALSKLSLPWKRGNQYTWDFWRDIAVALRQNGQSELATALNGAIRRNARKRVLKRALRFGG